MKREDLKAEPMEVAPARVEPSIAEIIGRAIDKGVDVATLERLEGLYIRDQERKAAREFADALAEFQAECPVIPKTEKAEIRKEGRIQYTYQFAPFDVVASTVQPYLHKHGFSYSFRPTVKDGILECVCILRHRGGHQEPSSFPIPTATKSGMTAQQEVGGALTFAKRYALLAALGISTGETDLDGADGPDRGELRDPASPDQIERLQARIVNERHNVDRLMAYLKKTMGVERLQDLEARDLPAVDACLDATLRAREAEGRKG